MQNIELSSKPFLLHNYTNHIDRCGTSEEATWCFLGSSGWGVMEYPEERTGDDEGDDTPMDKHSEGLSSTYVSSGDVMPPSVSRSVSNSNENLPKSTKEEKIRNKDKTGGREKGAFISRQSSVEEEEETFKERERRFLNENAPISTQRAQDKTKKLKMDEQSEEGEERKEHGTLGQNDFTKMMPRSSTQESEAVSTSDHVVTSPPVHTVLHSVRTLLFKNKQLFLSIYDPSKM